ncbi:MAG: beta-hydroxyacyl-ACP dehydratase [Planctomycetales bacterium]|nr:beta-hydroxyacyl-ACP dehydratase [Planctomycetales bacterium]
MRWFWIDRFEEFVVGKQATALKNVTYSEEPIDDYLPGRPHYPHSLIIEGMAQTGGILIAQMQDFHPKVVLAKIGKAEFNSIVVPGDQLRMTAKLMSLQSDGAIIEGHVTVNHQPLAEMELAFGILDDSFGDTSFFLPGGFFRILRSLRLFEVARHEDGSPIQIPDYMLEAVRQEAAQ